MGLNIFELMQATNNYELTFYEEPSVGLRSIIAINNTVLGPVLATTKIAKFKDVEQATRIALRMAYYNTFRAALLRRQFGGGSIVLCADPKKVRNNEFFFRALGIYINKFAGKLFVARSADLTVEDIQYIMRETEFVLGGDEVYLREGMSPAEATAKGIILGIAAAVKDKFGKDDFRGLRFVVQGIDEIGYHIVKALLNEGDVDVVITDQIYDKIKEIQDEFNNVKVVKPNEIYSQECDIFISCTFDNSISEVEANQLKTKILTSSVNNVVYSEEVEKILAQKDILYIPGYVINGGEIILFDNEFDGHDPEVVEQQLVDIYTITLDLLRKAKEQQKTVNQVAIETAEFYIENIASIKKLR